MHRYKILAVVLILLVTTIASAQVSVGDEAPNFDGTLVSGKYFSLHETLKDSIVVIYFMGYS